MQGLIRIIEREGNWYLAEEAISKVVGVATSKLAGLTRAAEAEAPAVKPAPAQPAPTPSPSSVLLTSPNGRCSVSLSLNDDGDIMAGQISGPNRGKSANLTYGKWGA